MQYLCLGYLDTRTFDSASEAEKSAILKECFAQVVPFRETGQVMAEEALQARPSPSQSDPATAAQPSPTVRFSRPRNSSGASSSSKRRISTKR
jgi:hypothetical protein